MNVGAAAPWYVHPAAAPSAWRRLGEGDSVELAVVNVANGPGTAPDDPYYGPALAAVSGASMLGYVSVGYGDRSAEVVRREAEAWREWYGVTGVMLDETPSAARSKSWSLDLIDRLRGDGASMVVANPGTVPVRELVEAADVTCVFEGSWESYRRLRLPRWLRQFPPGRLWHLVHSCPGSCLPSVRRLAARRGAGYAWATSGTLPDPWSVLPEAW